MGAFKRLLDTIIVFCLFLLVTFSFLSMLGCDESKVSRSAPYDENCNLKPTFETDWRKYSDFDYRIDISDRSYEAKQYHEAEKKYIKNEARIYELKQNIFFEQEKKAELIRYKQALVMNIKTNLLKSFWRLSWITYSTIQSAKGTGKTYAGLFDTAEKAGITIAADSIKVARSMIHGQSALALDKNKTSRKVADVAISGALEAASSLGDPLKVATEVVSSTHGNVLPSADITPEEIAILRTQHLDNKAIDMVIQDSAKRITTMYIELDKLEADTPLLEAQLIKWETEEKARVADGLIGECKRITGQDE